MRKFFVGLLLLPIFVFSNEISLVDQFSIAIRQNLSVYPYEELDWPSNDTRFADFLAFIYKSQHPLQENCTRRVVFNILKRSLKKQDYKSVYIDGATYKDLNCFCGQSEPEHYLLNIMDRSLTALGFARLSMMLSTPSVDINTLLIKQAIIKELVKNPDMIKQLRTELEFFKKVQSSLYVFWIRDPFRQAIERRYFHIAWDKFNTKLNNSEFALNVGTIFDHKNRCIYAASLIIAGVVLPIYATSQLVGKQDVLPDKAQTLAMNLYSSGSPLFGILKSLISQPSVIAALGIGSGVLSALRAPDAIYWAKDNFELDRYLDQKMSDIALAFRSLRNIHSIIEKNLSLKKLLQDYAGLHELYSEDTSSKITNFLRALKQYQHLNNDKLLINSGRALTLFKDLIEIKDDLEPALVSLAEIDAFVGLASLYQEAEHAENKYCFPDFCISKTPQIEIVDFWNPLVKAEKNVVNSVSLGIKNNARGMIITGPNAGGKSTLLKSIALSIIMGQSFGIVPAASGTISIFDCILTYLNITDEISEGNSLFKNQVLRVQNLYSSAEFTGNNSGLCLLILDEMFNGTSPKEAQTCAMSVAYLLAKASHVSTILATHFHNLTLLPQETDAYQNYHVSVSKNQNGGIEYPFKLEPGISNQHIALDILQQEGFDNVFINQAVEFLDAHGRDVLSA